MKMFEFLIVAIVASFAAELFGAPSWAGFLGGLIMAQLVSIEVALKERRQ